MHLGGQNFQIHGLTMKDYDQMVQLWETCGLPFRPRGRDSRRAIKAQMRADPDFFLGAFEDSHLIGTVIISCEGRKGWINRLAVDPEHRRKGIARALIVEAERVLRERGIRVYCVLIKDSNESSRNLFKKAGYKELKDIRYFSKRDSEEVLGLD